MDNDDDKKDVLANAKAFFERAQAYEAAQRADELDDIRFVGLLQQWPEEIRRIRESDPQGARPTRQRRKGEMTWAVRSTGCPPRKPYTANCDSATAPSR